MNYDEMYDECFYEWEVVETRFQIIGNLQCKSICFSNADRRKQGRNSILTFFIVNGNIIADANENCENISIFGKEF